MRKSNKKSVLDVLNHDKRLPANLKNGKMSLVDVKGFRTCSSAVERIVNIDALREWSAQIHIVEIFVHLLAPVAQLVRAHR